MEHNTRKTLPERSQRDYWENQVNKQVRKSQQRARQILIMKVLGIEQACRLNFNKFMV
jgi:hypothetical protein